MELRGNIGRQQGNKIIGWAFDKAMPEKHLTVKVKLNGTPVGKAIADIPRLKMKESNLHPTGACGFEFSIDDLHLEESVNVLNFEFDGTDVELKNSPFIIDNRTFENRVLIVGLNKSGTSILTYRVASGLKTNKIHFEPRSNLGLSDYQPHIGYTDRDNVVTKCLYHPGKSTQLQAVASLYDKRIWIQRDPRDILISSFFYMWYKGHNKPLEKFNNAFDRVKLKEQDPQMSFIKMLKGTVNIKKYLELRILPVVQRTRSLDNNWFVLRYEDFIQENVQELNQYLGFNIDQNEQVRDNVKRVSRSKSFDNWRDWFVEEDLVKLKEWFNPYLEAFGYDTNDWRLNENVTLNPSVGSDYMYNLFYNS